MVDLALSRIMFSLVIVLVMVVSLGSLAYPLVDAPVYSTQTIINTSTYRQTSSMMVSVASYGVSYYYETTSKPIIIPDLSSCSGPIISPLPACYYVIWATTTKTLSTPVTGTSTSTTYTTTTNEQAYTNWLTNTQYQKIPLFAAFGLSESQFTIIALLIIAVSGIAIFYTYNRSKKI
ncbi:MAG TPA: hypothetical protein VJZ75_06085 [Candidatus Bathyarchaeia archaeon]|nr:hypothetical protein [Candidatus Bathyarchaeia archaeon]